MIFIELRCGYEGLDLEECGPDRCLSISNETPHAWSGDAQKDVATTHSGLMKEARSEGWVVTKDQGLLCPGCAKKHKRNRRTAA